MKKYKLSIIPGFIACILIAFFSIFLENLLPIHLIGSSVIALFIGIVINSMFTFDTLNDGVSFASKDILRIAIIILGASLSVGTILSVGKISLYVMTFTLITCFFGGYFIGKALGLNWKLSNLISAGTGICGGSAIAAIAPVIEAKDSDIAYAMSATFLFDMIMIILFPIMGHLLGLSDMAYGLWSGTAVNDTSSVVAAGYAFSESAGDFATMVKLTRTLSIIPIVIIFSFINLKLKNKDMEENSQKESPKVNFLSLFPWFILGFLLLSGINSIGLIPVEVSTFLKELSKFLMVVALAGIGLKTNFKDMKQSGIKPMIHGFIISLLVVVVAIGAQWTMGLV